MFRIASSRRTVLAATLVVAGLVLSADGGFALTSAQPQTASTSVNVTNTASRPVPVLQEGAATAVQVRVYAAIPAASATLQVAVYTVPAGKRLVGQVVSAYRSGTYTSTMQAYLNPQIAGSFVSYALPLIGAGDTLGATLAAPFYADPSTTVYVNFYRSTTGSGESDSVTMTGYLVDAQ